MNARVIAAFPATGKSHLAARTPGVIDSDSSSFSWTHRGPDARVRHPEWPGNYMHHIREMLQSSLRLRLVLVSTHAEGVAGGNNWIDTDDVAEDAGRHAAARRRSPASA